MNSEQLRDALTPFLTDDNLGISLYAVIKGAETSPPQKLDIEDAATPGLLKMFQDEIRDNLVDNPELSVVSLSSADERTHAIYEYDLEIPDDLKSLQLVTSTDDIELLAINNSSLTQIKAVIIEIGNDVGQLVLYKTMAAINIFRRDGFFLMKHAHRLTRINEEFLRLSAGFQMLQVQDTLLIRDLSTIEKQFGFHEVILREASASLDAIERMDLLEDAGALRQLVDDVRFARKLTKVARSSPVLALGISNEAIIDFCKHFPTLSKTIKTNKDGDKIVLDTQASKMDFIKLLMDDYLYSELTKRHYESLAKDSAEEAEEGSAE